MKRRAPIKIGDKVGRRTVIASAPPRGALKRLVVRCACGIERTVYQKKLRSSKSCGCLTRETNSGPHPERRRHGAAGAGRSVRGRWPEYRLWSSIVQACFNTKHHSYATVGGRGVGMSVRWRRDFKEFLKDVGRRPREGMALLRKNKRKGFFPGNVHWVRWGRGKAA